MSLSVKQSDYMKAQHQGAQETISRSIVKAISWRIIGTLDTFILSVFVIKFLGPIFGMTVDSGNQDIAITAGYIAAAETITKIFIYSIHERIWVKLGWGVVVVDRKRSETYRRSALKMTTWRIIASLDTMLLAWIFTGNILTAISIGTFEIFTKLVLYFIHERIWQKLQIGTV